MQSSNRNRTRSSHAHAGQRWGPSALRPLTCAGFHPHTWHTTTCSERWAVHCTPHPSSHPSCPTCRSFRPEAPFQACGPSCPCSQALPSWAPWPSPGTAASYLSWGPEWRARAGLGAPGLGLGGNGAARVKMGPAFQGGEQTTKLH